MLLVAACASIGNPSGGARDEDPPRFVRANPQPYAVDVPLKTERINIDFDELVNVKDAFSKVVVSPPSKNVPRVASSGHRVTVTFTDSLQPNTTYTINFADAIEDNNEGNPLENFSYSFSTGPTIDSLRIAGRVLSAEAMEPMQGKIVGVHMIPEHGDSLIVPSVAGIPDTLLTKKSLPLIFHKMFDRVARTDDRGRFSIEGLAPGRYRLYAIDDTNSDYLFSSPDEEMAFYDAIISPYASEGIANDTVFDPKLGTVDSVVNRRRTIYLPNDILMRSFLTRRKQQFISNYSRQDSTRIQLTFNAPNNELPGLILTEPQLSGNDWYVMERSQHNDSLTLWIRDPKIISADTLRLAVTYPQLDSLSRYTLRSDTLRLTTDRPRKPKAEKQEKKKKDEVADTLPPTVEHLNVSLITTTMDPDGKLIFKTDTPLARLDSAAFRLEEKRDTLWIPAANVVPLRDSINPRLYSVGHPWKYDTQYRLIADTLAMEGIYGLTTAPLNMEFHTKAEKDYCSLTMTLTDWPTGLPAFVEVLNQSDKPVRRRPLENGKVRFNHLSPGKYYLRVVADMNANGVWDSGDILETLQPEPSFYYPKAINIKQNWNKEESWAVFSTPADSMKPSVLLKNKPTQRKNQRNTGRNTTDDEDEEDEESLFPSRQAQRTNMQQRRM